MLKSAEFWVLGTILSFASGTIPPLILKSSGRWEGTDGPWSTFDIQIGTPPQTVSVHPSTGRSELWVWNSTSCTSTSEYCSSVFNALLSSSFTAWDSTHDFNQTRWDDREGYDTDGPSIIGQWSNKSYPQDNGKIKYDYDLCAAPFAQMGYTGFAYHARDATTTALTDGTEFSGNQSAIALLSTENPYIGLLGLNIQRTCRVRAVYPLGPTFFDQLKQEAMNRGLGDIWSYTAGAYNQGKNSMHASLIVGGVDTSRFVNHTMIKGDLGYNYKSHPKNLSVTILDFKIQQGESISQHYQFDEGQIDTSISDILAPKGYCQFLERTIGIQKDNFTGLYLVNDTMHRSLLRSNPSFHFNLSLTTTWGSRFYYLPQYEQLVIDLPYSSFLLNITHPLEQTNNYYLPLKCTNTSSSWIFGRAFMQQAYMIVAGRYWYLAKAKLDPNMPPNPVGYEGKDIRIKVQPRPRAITHYRLSSGAIIGIALSAAALLLMIATLYLKKQARSEVVEVSKPNVDEDPPPSYGGPSPPSYQLDYIPASRR